MSLRSFIIVLAASALGAFQAAAQAAPAIAPKFLVDPTQPGYEKQVVIEQHQANGQVTVAADGAKLAATFAPGDAGYPGFSIKTPDGKPFDLSPWGNVSAKITNTSPPGSGNLNINLRVDNAGRWQDNPWNTEGAWLKPGESKTIKVIFGHHYGHKPGYKLDPSKVTQILIFTGKIKNETTFTIEDLMASGAAGETPPVNPATVRFRPKNGVFFGPGLEQPFDPAKQTTLRDGATSEQTPAKSLAITLPKKSSAATIKPAIGFWTMIDWHTVEVTLKNTGANPANPKVRVDSEGGSTATVTPAKPIPPGKTATIAVSFVPKTPWTGPTDLKGTHIQGLPNTGTRFENTKGKGVTITSDEPADLELTAIIATAPPVPTHITKTPPFQGKWKQTLDENFDKPLDLKVWNIYTDNYWDKRTHFTKDNNIVKDGHLILRYEKKRGYQNDDPTSAFGDKGQTDYACGHADTYGKWTQRYGYFEARMKLPRCPGLWPAFWTMPDRGFDAGPEQWKRASTHNGGMELDIMEHLTAWGPYRFNSAFHWDGYEKGHKATGTSHAYAPTDKDGFFTIGMLWLPGEITYYANGVEVVRWQNERVCSQQSNLIFYMVSGGWANTPLDDKQLPADFVIDYVRAWQRDDLATPEDGHKPNDGRPKMHSQKADGN